MPTNVVTHIEWDTADHVKLKDFLSGLFGWQFTPYGDNYFITDDTLTGVSVGVNRSERPQTAGGSPGVYVTVKSIDETLTKAKSLGGSVAVPKSPIPGMGSYAVAKAPDGNLIGLFEAAG